MGNSQKDKVFILICLALMLVCSTAEQEYFFHSENLSWADARNHCQACYKDLVTLTPQNIQSVHRKLTSDCWVGLRKNFSSTTNSTTMTWPGWTRWANGDPLVFQNWYPGWPVLKSSLPKSYCCSCSCTCPATPTPTMTGFTEFTSSNMTSFTSVTDQSWTNSSGLNETNSAPMTTALPRAAACDRSPMLPDIPNIDENYIEDSCVAMLSFGAWVEKNCSELLPSICYEDIFHGQVNVTYVTKESANLTWLPGPGNISSYRLEVKGGILPTYNLTNLTYDLVNLTAGTYYSVRVFPVKCERDLNPQVVSFYTVPNKVEILNVTMVTETSVSLSWDKPAGGTVSYIINVQGEKNQNIQTNLTSYTVNSLIPGNLYTFTVTSEVEDKSQRSEGFNITKYTKPSKVSNLRVSDITNNSLLLTWAPPIGNATSYKVKAVNDSNFMLFDNSTEKQTNVTVTGLPAGTKIILSVAALVNDTEEGNTVTIISYTVPNKVEILNVTMVTETSVSLSWDKPDGGTVSYIINVQGEKNQNIQTNLTSYTVNSLIPGNLYTFTVTSEVEDKSQRSDESIYPSIRCQPTILCTWWWGSLSEGFNITKYTKPSKVSNLQVSDITNNSLQLTWAPPIGNATSYKVKAVNDSNYMFDNCTVKQTNVNVTNLPAGTKITLSVAAMVNDTEEGDYVTTVNHTAPNPISNLNLVPTNVSLNANWDPPVGNYSSFKIVLQLDGQTLNTKNSETPRMYFDNLTAAVKYTVTVYSVGGNLSSTPVTLSKFTLPNKVEILNVTMVTETSVSLSWDKPAGGTVSYIINVQGEKNQSIQTNLTSYTVNSLIPGNLYTFTVTSEVEDKSQRSEGFNIMKYTKPSKVSNLRVSNITTTSLQLTWAPPTGNATSYRVKAVNDSNHMFDNCTEKQTNVTVTNLPAGTKITLSVAALVNDTEEGDYVTTVNYTVPNKVEILNVKMVTETSVSLSWDKPDGGTVSYIINVQGEKNQNIQTNLTSYTVNSLIPGNLYTFTVTSEVEDKSQRSEGFNIMKYTKPSKVSNLQVSDITNNSLQLTWAPPIGNATSYKVKAVNDSNYMFDNCTVKQTNVNVTNLPAGTKITLSVAAMVNDTEEGDYVTTVNHTAPNPISNLNLVPTNVSLNANWDPPVGNYSSFKIVLQLDGQTLNTTTSETPRMYFHNLTAAAKYTVTVYSVGGNLSSTPVTLSKFTLPSPPTDITATSSNKSITFSWKAPVNSHTVNYSVTIDSSFWVSTESHLLNDQTSYTFSNLKSGTKYNFTVKSVAHDLSSDPTSASYSTVPVSKTVSLSMLCSSAERLYCDKSTTREMVFQQLKKHFTTNWGDRIVWHLEQQKSEN